MRTSSLRTLMAATVAVVAFSFSAGIAHAQAFYQGTFTLPFTAQWGGMVLTPGQYTFVLDSASSRGIITVRHENRGVGMVFAMGRNIRRNLAQSELIAVSTGDAYRVRALRLAEVGMTLDFAVPKSKGRLMAEAPQLIRHIAVTRSGK
jgi:hypothetical protein